MTQVSSGNKVTIGLDWGDRYTYYCEVGRGEAVRLMLALGFRCTSATINPTASLDYASPGACGGSAILT